MPKPAPLLIPAQDLQDRYEQLRRCALQPSPSSRQWSGLDILLHQGLRSWMEALASHASSIDTVAARSLALPSETVTSRETSTPRELPRLLADIVLKNQGFPSRRILRHQMCQESNTQPICFPSSERSIHNHQEVLQPCPPK